MATKALCENAPREATRVITLSVSPSSVSEGDAQTDITVTGTLNGTALTTETVVTLSVTRGTAGTGDYTVGTISPPYDCRWTNYGDGDFYVYTC